VKLLVTGATGFLGGRIAERLVAAGHEVRALVRDPRSRPAADCGAEPTEGDVTDGETVLRAARGCDAIVHAAALVRVWVPDSREFERVNVQGFEAVARAADQRSARLVYVSSFLALGASAGKPLDETARADVARSYNHYQRTKIEADRRARALATAGRDIVRVYPGVVFGPGRLTAGNHVVRLLLDHARGKLPGILGRGDRRQCFAFIDDVVEGVVLALDRARPGSGYVLGGENRTPLELFRAFARASGIAEPKRRIPFAVAELIGRAARWRADRFGVEPALTDEVVRIYRNEWAYSSDRAARELGYRITPFEDAIDRTVAWLRSIGEIPARTRS
jgi:NAD+-dependent farnesol dehydrogenase